MSCREEYLSILQDEASLSCGLRKYEAKCVRLMKEMHNFYQFYTKDCQVLLKLRAQTVHLAFNYLTQIISRSYTRVKTENLTVIGVTSILIACKFDEIDYQLPSANKILKLARESPFLRSYHLNFTREDVCSCEQEITNNILQWNFHQVTPFHAMRSLIGTGIVFDSDSISERRGGMI